VLIADPADDHVPGFVERSSRDFQQHTVVPQQLGFDFASVALTLISFTASINGGA